MAIELKELCFGYGKRPIIKNLSHRFDEGKIHCIMGASGCGKTTLLHLLAGLLKPSSGTIVGARKLKRAMVFQEDRLADYLSVQNNIMLTAKKGTSPYEIAALLHALELGDVENACPAKLSGGMRRRVALARALAAEFDLLLLDEPFSGLDEMTRDLAMQIIRENSADKLVIMTTHDLSLASEKDIAVLKL